MKIYTNKRGTQNILRTEFLLDEDAFVDEVGHHSRLDIAKEFANVLQKTTVQQQHSFIAVSFHDNPG